jgi:mono/diheme cytochrome c family protein
MSSYFSDKAQEDYLWGIYLLRQGDEASAQVRLARVLEIQPGHELARSELGYILEVNDDLQGALGQFVELAARSGGMAPARVRLSRVLRTMGRIEDARAVVAPLGSRPEPGPEFRGERGLIFLAAGDYEEVERQCRETPPELINDDMLMLTALATNFRQKPQQAHRLFLKFVDLVAVKKWESEVKLRRTTDPGDLAAAKKRAQLTGAEVSALLDVQEATTELPGTAPAGKATTAAENLFRVHCGACHGLRGDGLGLAAKHLFPRPRNLRAGMCQLVSTVNGVPTAEDIQQVLARGMPGTAMRSFEELPAADRRLLGEEVLRLRGEGVREQVTAALRHEGEEIDESDIRRAVRRATTPGKQVPLPAQWPDAGPTALRGKANFAALGCAKCHGETGSGAADQDLFDDLGEPSRPRDLVHEPLKGGREREAIYRRIVAGMPGTPHPATLDLSPQQVIELVDYVRWLAREPPRTLTNHQRRVLATTPAYLESIRDGGT